MDDKYGVTNGLGRVISLWLRVAVLVGGSLSLTSLHFEGWLCSGCCHCGWEWWYWWVVL